jgi:transcriptional regulator with XRE-family HTH domain
MRTEGSKALRAWLHRSLIPAAELAAELGISRPYMSQILHGDRRPSLELMLAIGNRTGVAVSSWAAVEVGNLAGWSRSRAKTPKLATS